MKCVKDPQYPGAAISSEADGLLWRTAKNNKEKIRRATRRQLAPVRAMPNNEVRRLVGWSGDCVGCCYCCCCCGTVWEGVGSI